MFVQVSLFGGLAVSGLTGSGIGSRKARALLASLLLARGAPIGTDRLADAVWGVQSPPRPAEALGVLASRLRRALGPDAVRHVGDSWATGLVAVDLAEFDARVAQATGRLAAGEVGAALAAARAALATAAAGPLLAGETGDVVEGERAAVAERVAAAALVAAHGALAVGDPLGAVAAAGQALDHDPYDEAALRILLRGHVATGRPAVALAAFAEFRARLADELGADPAPETVELHSRILRGEERTSVTPAPAALVGRSTELAWLRAATAGPVVAVIVGDAGIGKSVLLDTFLTQVRADMVVVAGRCDPLGHDLPLQPLLDGLDAVLRGLGRDGADAVLGSDAAAVAPLLADGPDPAAAPDAPAPVDPGTGRALLFAALLRVLGRVTDRTGMPVLIAVDDLHLAAEGTLAWLRFAARRGSDRVRIVVTMRPGSPALPDHARLLELGPLDLAAATELVGERAADLWVPTGGNPLLLTALAGVGADGARGLSAVLRELLDSLGPAAGTIRVAAVLGADVDLDLVAAVCGKPAAAVLDDLDLARRARLLVERPVGLGFGHELLREAVQAGGDLSDAHRALLHRAAADELASRPGRDPLAVAWHARLGGRLALAARELRAAAGHAVRRSDLVTAERLSREAQDLDPTPEGRLALAEVLLRRSRLPDAADEAAAAIAEGAPGHELAGWIAYYQRRYPAALRFAERARAAAATGPAGATVRGTVLALAGRVHHSTGDLSASEAALEAALREAPPDSDGTPRLWLAALHVHQGRPAEALAGAEAALEYPAAIRHPFAAGHGHFARWYALGMLGRADEALAAVESYRNTEHADHVASRYAAIALNMRSWLRRGLGELGPAEQDTLAALELGVSPGVAEPQVQSRLDLVELALAAGDADGAAQRLAAVVLEPRDSGTMAWHQRERYGLLTARVALARGDGDLALAAASPVRTAAARRGSRRHALVAELLVACAGGPAPGGPDAVAGLLDRLDAVAGLESWRWTTLAAEQLRVDAWHALAERRAAAVAARAGELRPAFEHYARTVLAGA